MTVFGTDGENEGQEHEDASIEADVPEADGVGDDDAVDAAEDAAEPTAESAAETSAAATAAEIAAAEAAKAELDEARSHYPWYVVQTYSGFEHRVKLSLDERNQTAQSQ